MVDATTVWTAAAVALVLLNILGAAVVVRDKRAARRHAPRVPERTLHLFGFLGAWPLMVVAMRVVRHKTRKRRFQVQFALASIVGTAAWAGFFWWSLRASL